MLNKVTIVDGEAQGPVHRVQVMDSEGALVALPREGVGSPEGVVVGSPGDLYRDRSPGGGLLWVKNTGVATNTGWKVVPFGEQVPTLDELVASSVLTTGTVTNTAAYPIFVAPFPLRIVAASVIIYETIGIAADSDLIYWSVEVRRARNNVETVMATKTTKLTGGQAVPLRGDWNFDAATWDADASLCAKGDIINVAFNEVGITLVGWAKPMATVRYVPV